MLEILYIYWELMRAHHSQRNSFYFHTSWCPVLPPTWLWRVLNRKIHSYIASPHPHTTTPLICFTCNLASRIYSRGGRTGKFRSPPVGRLQTTSHCMGKYSSSGKFLRYITPSDEFHSGLTCQSSTCVVEPPSCSDLRSFTRSSIILFDVCAVCYTLQAIKQVRS